MTKIKVWCVDDVDRAALDVEARRLAGEVDVPGDPVGYLRDDYDVACPGTAEEVLHKSRSVMQIVNRWSQSDRWPSDGEWPDLMPAWFVAACKSEAEDYEDDSKLQGMSVEDEMAHHLAVKWKLLDWLYWMEPENREWMWWAAETCGPDVVRITADRLGDPVNSCEPPGFWWLFSACGATNFDFARTPRYQSFHKDLEV